jgi:membrane protein DedA with SNARE-associated domain
LLPAVGVYAALGVLSALENIFPPVPADTAAALGAFLAAREPHLNLLTVYLVTVIANCASAIGVFLAGRHYGRAFFATRLGRSLVSETTLHHIEAAYHKHHWWGLFISRFLWGYRAVTPPFAGLAGLRLRQAAPPIVLATALYYGLLVLLAWHVGTNWERVQHMVHRLGLSLGLLAAAVTVLLVWAVRRYRRRLKSEPR